MTNRRLLLFVAFAASAVWMVVAQPFRAGTVYSVASTNELTQLWPSTAARSVFVPGDSGAIDSSAAMWTWDATSTATDNDHLPSALGAVGRWVRNTLGSAAGSTNIFNNSYIVITNSTTEFSYTTNIFNYSTNVYESSYLFYTNIFVNQFNTTNFYTNVLNQYTSTTNIFESSTTYITNGYYYTTNITLIYTNPAVISINGSNVLAGNLTAYHVPFAISTNILADSPLEVAGTLVTTPGNIGAILVAGASSAIDLKFASTTNAVSGAVTILHATNGIDKVEASVIRYWPNGSGSDQTLTLPINSSGVNGWRTNSNAAVPSKLTNGTITVLYGKFVGPTGTLAQQTNFIVQGFDYIK